MLEPLLVHEELLADSVVFLVAIAELDGFLALGLVLVKELGDVFLVLRNC